MKYIFNSILLTGGMNLASLKQKKNPSKEELDKKIDHPNVSYLLKILI